MCVLSTKIPFHRRQDTWRIDNGSMRHLPEVDQCYRRSDVNNPRRELQPKYQTSENEEAFIRVQQIQSVVTLLKFRGLRRNDAFKGEKL